MKEKDDDNISVKSRSNISDLLNNSLLINPKKINEEEENDDIPLDLSNIHLEDLEMGSKVLCPEQDCFSNAIIQICPIFFEVRYDCGKHKNKIDILEYVKNSGISKEDKQTCSKCQLTYDNLKKNNKDLYKCNCGGNYCNNCKEEHLNKNKDNNIKHKMVEFAVKDHICCCSNKNYIDYCINCNKNLCIGCSKEHRGNDHIKKHFGELFQLGKDKKKIFKKNIEEQKNKIKQFKKIVENWFERSKKALDIYIKKLELYNKINEVIFNQYNSGKNYETIKNIEYIRLDFDNNFNRLLKEDNNYKSQTSIICNLLNDFLGKYKNKNNKENSLMKLDEKDKEKLNGIVNHITELKKEDLIVINITNQNDLKEEICIYKKLENNEKKIEFHLSINEDSKILDLFELKNGNLLILKKDEFKIIEISKKQKSIKIMYSYKPENNEYFKQIKELINGSLIAILYSNEEENEENKNNIIYLEKNLISGNYEKNKTQPINEKVIFLLENNKYECYVLCEGNKLYSFNIKKEKLNYLLDFQSIYKVKKIIKVAQDCLLLLFQNFLILINFFTTQYKIQECEFQIDDISIIDDNNNYLLSFSQDDKYGLLSLNINILQNSISINPTNLIKNKHKNIINNVYKLSDGNIVTTSLGKLLYIWEKK